MGNQQVIRLRVGGMHCQACANRVVKALSGVPGVQEVAVDLEAGEAQVVLAGPAVAEAALAQAVVEAGYEFGGRVA